MNRWSDHDWNNVWKSSHLVDNVDKLYTNGAWTGLGFYILSYKERLWKSIYSQCQVAGTLSCHIRFVTRSWTTCNLNFWDASLCEIFQVSQRCRSAFAVGVIEIACEHMYVRQTHVHRSNSNWIHVGLLISSNCCYIFLIIWTAFLV